jgi:hypothetical protein
MKDKPNTSIRMIARIHDRATNVYVEKLEFSHPGGERGSIELQRSIVNDPAALKRRLEDAGAILPSHNWKEILKRVAESKPQAKFAYDARTGWTEERNAFVLPDGVIGQVDIPVLGVRQSTAASSESGRLGKRGTVKSWRSSVSSLSKLSSIFMTSVCAAFAAPLLAITGTSSFALCIAGPSRSGKSLAEVMAGTVIGIGSDDDLLKWNTTDARLEQRLAGFNDSVFLIDDLMGMKETGRDRYSRIQRLAYKIAQGRTTGRFEAAGNSGSGAQASWRTVLITSYETSLRDLARSVHEERMRGEAVRLIDLPAMDDNADHIFDRVKHLPPAIDFARWKVRKFEQIIRSCRQNNGTAFRKYIEMLIGMGPQLERYVGLRIEHFLSHVAYSPLRRWTARLSI